MTAKIAVVVPMRRARVATATAASRAAGSSAKTVAKILEYALPPLRIERNASRNAYGLPIMNLNLIAPPNVLRSSRKVSLGSELRFATYVEFQLRTQQPALQHGRLCAFPGAMSCAVSTMRSRFSLETTTTPSSSANT